jgi:hypothetical protein
MRDGYDENGHTFGQEKGGEGCPGGYVWQTGGGRSVVLKLLIISGYWVFKKPNKTINCF